MGDQVGWVHPPDRVIGTWWRPSAVLSQISLRPFRVLLKIR
jgi:hypothetical protein